MSWRSASKRRPRDSAATHAHECPKPEASLGCKRVLKGFRGFKGFKVLKGSKGLKGLKDSKGLKGSFRRVQRA